ncbi:MAG: DNA translocase FtsK [Bacteroidales bacterium]|nr:DNA translocase FtsK [Bacteroidales bacterium]
MFGIGAFGFALLFFVYGMRLWKVQVLPWWKTLGSTLFWMLWISLLLGYIGGAWVRDGTFDHFAGVGLIMAGRLDHWIGWWTLVVLLFVAVLFLVLVHGMELPKIEVGRIAKKVEHEIAEVATEHEERKEKKKKAAASGMGAVAADEAEGDDEPQGVISSSFDEEAQKLFNSHGEGEEQEGEEAAAGVEEMEGGANAEQALDIDAEFERINRVAQGGGDDEVSFTIEETSPVAESGAVGDEASEGVDIEFDENGEPLDPDDYRRHYGLDEPYDPHLDLRDYQMPSTDLLEDSEVRNVKVTREELVANKDRIVQTLRDYGIEITEITATPGPTVTLYKIKPAPGIRISKIKGLENDIALSLAALGIRIIAPIPGESNIGIEVPNAKPQIVAMKTMLESDAFRNAKMELPIAFGKTISNECFVTDLAKMPHLLMAGATGTGKSVGLNAVLASLLYKKHPSELKLVLVDPKKVEFSLYSAITRHYLAKMPDEAEAVITDVKKVVRTLNSLCIEMDTRYDLLKQAKVRKITEYNEKFCKRMLNPEHGHRYLPYIVVVIDEFGDLIMTAGKEVELPIARLAQLARAVGIHLIIATQRPTTNIITGTIKANFPARVAFRVTSGIDSKTILDTGGAQQLIGRGDMLISLAGKDMIRLQCALIDTPEIEKLMTFIGEQRGYPDGFELPEYLDENEEPNKEFDAKSKDEFFNDAARLVVSSQFGSTSLLQRKLQLGYNRAGRIIDQLEAAGIVGPSNGSKPRDVLIHDEVALEELLKNL